MSLVYRLHFTLTMLFTDGAQPEAIVLYGRWQSNLNKKKKSPIVVKPDLHLNLRRNKMNSGFFFFVPGLDKVTTGRITNCFHSVQFTNKIVYIISNKTSTTRKVNIHYSRNLSLFYNPFPNNKLTTDSEMPIYRWTRPLKIVFVFSLISKNKTDLSHTLQENVCRWKIRKKLIQKYRSYFQGARQFNLWNMYLSGKISVRVYTLEWTREYKNRLTFRRYSKITYLVINT